MYCIFNSDSLTFIPQNITADSVCMAIMVSFFAFCLLHTFGDIHRTPPTFSFLFLTLSLVFFSLAHLSPLTTTFATAAAGPSFSFYKPFGFMLDPSSISFQHIFGPV